MNWSNIPVTATKTISKKKKGPNRERPTNVSLSYVLDLLDTGTFIYDIPRNVKKAIVSLLCKKEFFTVENGQIDLTGKPGTTLNSPIVASMKIHKALLRSKILKENNYFLIYFIRGEDPNYESIAQV
jgi:hypothetical protein